MNTQSSEVAATQQPLAQAVHASKRFGHFTAVDDVSISIRPGEIVGLLGANGAGKTTLIKMLLGLEVPSSGEVSMFGEAPSVSTRRRLGYVPQGSGLWTTLTVQENLDFAASAYGHDRGRELSPELAAVRKRTVGDIGLGLQRRLVFEIALAHEPELLVLDEPTSGVDPLSRARLWDTVHAQAEAGVGVLVTTHYMQEAQQCDRLVLMSSGTRVAAGTEAQIIGDTTAIAVEVTNRDQDWADAFDVLSAAGLPVMLDGTQVRVADTSVAEVKAALKSAHIKADLHEVPATLEETMTVVEGR